MKEFLTTNGVKHITSFPYHLSNIGLTEHTIQTMLCKSALKKISGTSLKIKLQQLLLNYRTTPQGTLATPLSQLVMGRQLEAHYNLEIPNLSKHVQNIQTTQKYHHDQHSRNQSFAAGDQVLVRNCNGCPNW